MRSIFEPYCREMAALKSERTYNPNVKEKQAFEERIPLE